MLVGSPKYAWMTESNLSGLTFCRINWGRRIIIGQGLGLTCLHLPLRAIQRRVKQPTTGHGYFQFKHVYLSTWKIKNMIILVKENTLGFLYQQNMQPDFSLLTLVLNDQTWFLHHSVLCVVAWWLCWFWHQDQSVFYNLGQDSKLGYSELWQHISVMLLVEILVIWEGKPS